MSAHRYWRINFTGNQTNALLVAEVELRAVASGPSVVAGGTLTTSHPGSGGDPYPVANTIDGNTATVWETPATVNYRVVSWVYDFGIGNDEDIVEIAVTGSNNNSYHPILVNVDCSDDGVSWSRVSYSGSMRGMPNSSTMILAVEPAPLDFTARALSGYRLLTNFPAGPAEFRVLTTMRFNVLSTGKFRIEGHTYIDDSTDIPVSRRVRLYRQKSGLLVAETRSDPVTGHYAFDGIADQKYFVVTHDDGTTYNGVIKDFITPEPM